jgi:hypothetical protein
MDKAVLKDIPKLITDQKGVLTSKDVPNNKTRSSSDHKVGSGTDVGINLTYSVQGFDTPTT